MPAARYQLDAPCDAFSASCAETLPASRLEQIKELENVLELLGKAVGIPS